jgi:uncharacterized protein YndB with AHSA1/START domain
MIDSIARDVELETSPEAVWDAISDPERLREWLADEVALTPVPGGDASFVVDGQERTGWVEEVSPPDEAGAARLTFWWQAAGEPASRVTIELEAIDGGTCLRVQETRPLEVLDLVGMPMPGSGGQGGGPMLVAA